MRILAEHSTFTNVLELNDAVYTHITRHYYDMNDTDRALLKQLSRYAVKYRGAAWLKADTLAAMLDVSSKTIRRGLTKLQALGIVEKRSTLRPVNGGYGANIIVILPPATVKASNVQSKVSNRTNRVELTDSKVAQASGLIESFNLLHKPFKSAKKTLQAADQAPATFSEHLTALISDKKQRREYFTAFKKQVAMLLKFDIYADKGEMLDTMAVRSLYITMKRQQAGAIANPIGYFYGTLRNQIDTALFSDINEVYSANPDELLAILPY